MKKTFLTLFIITVIALAVLPVSTFAQANTTTIQDSFPLAGLPVDTPEGCENLVHTAGEIHVVTHITDLGDGNALLMMHFQPRHAVLVGLDTGNIYHGVGVTREVQRTLGPGESTSFVNVFMQVPEVGIQEVYHVTVNANGEITMEFDRVTYPGFSCLQ